MMRPLVLASTSSARRAVLARLGLPFQALAPSFDEVVPPGALPADVATAFALGKARSLVQAHEGAVVIGADQVLALDDELFRKPETVDEATSALLRLAGRTHHLHSALAVVAGGAERTVLVSVPMTMRALSPEVLRRYAESGEATGSWYRFEGPGIALFESAGGEDTAILGLPLLPLVRLLRDVGVDPLDR